MARNRRVLWDGRLDMNAHVGQVCRTAYCNVSAIRRMLTREVAEILVYAFVSSRLDHCNSLLYGLPDTSINKVQSVQNAAARVIMGTGKRNCIIPCAVYQLHWFPVRQRIHF